MGHRHAKRVDTRIPEIRLGDLTRFPVLFPERLFREGQQVGWAEPYRNKNGGLHWSFLPQLLPTFIEFFQSQIDLSPNNVQIAVVGAGLADDPSDAAAARARQAATRLIRDAKFGKDVVEAYGKKCAMCGLNLGLVSGAHILPVSAAARRTRRQTASRFVTIITALSMVIASGFTQ
jgi:hypothetical protein